MGLISNIYRKQFVCRYDKAIGVPYHSLSDYERMKMENGTFLNSNGIEIHYFNYHFGKHKAVQERNSKQEAYQRNGNGRADGAVYKELFL